jgi:hypothetical protein
MKSEPIRLYCISTQAERLPNDIAVSVRDALNARQAFLAGLDVIAYAKTLKDTNACRGVRRDAIARGEAAADDALQAALQAASQAASHAAQLCRWIGREDLACAHVTEGARLLEAVDINDPQAWSTFSPGLVAAMALARGFHPGFSNNKPLSNALLSTHRSSWPELVDAILVEPQGPAPRAREGAQAAFVVDLLELVERLRGGNHCYNDALWRLGSFNNDNGAVDRLWACSDTYSLWRGHDVPVSLVEIEVAGYAELAAVLREVGEKDPNSHNGNRTVMGWLQPYETQKVMPAVADFLERLVKIMECRGP